jgi:signal transduction histidine kinase
MQEQSLNMNPPLPQAGFVARHEPLWLGLMLLALHAATTWGIGTAWSSGLLLAHFGLFLMWQPLWQGDGELRTSHAVLAVLYGALLAMVNSWWLIALWLAALIALIGGGVPGITARRARIAAMLASLYLLALLLLWVVPQVSGPIAENALQTRLVRYGLPLIAAAILFIRPVPPRPAATIAVDLFYSVMLFLLVAALVLGSLVLVKTNQGQYLVALAQTLMVIAIALIGLSWLMSPQAGFAGFDQLLSRYLLSVGLPFEQWVQRLADLAQRESEPPQFLVAAVAHLQALPWVQGLRWDTPMDTGTSGRLGTHHADFAFDELKLQIHTRWGMSPAMLLHVRLLAQMVGHFYAAKQREALQRRNAYTQAIHETGSRLTHDVKNLLQSLQVLCAVAQDDDPALQGELVKLVQRQLPQITQRLNTTLDKLRAPDPVDAHSARVTTWWRALQQRYGHRGVTLTLVGELPDAMAPAEMFDNVVDNLLENALRKTSSAQVVFEPAHMAISVADTGAAMPQALAAQLFSAPVSSNAGLGVGLYHAARFAAQQGYALTLACNQDGDVCFMLRPTQNNKTV